MAARWRPTRGHGLRPDQSRYARKKRAPRTSRANRHPDQSIGKPVVTSCAPGSAIDSATQRRKQNTFLCVRSSPDLLEDSESGSSHATGNHRYAEPVASHKNMFCLLRPPGARKTWALRLISTPQPPAILRGAGSGLRRLAQLARLPALRGRRVRGDHHPPKTLRGGLRYAPP
jgi:hypothetical protein